jgi:hypothetical protein
VPLVPRVEYFRDVNEYDAHDRDSPEAVDVLEARRRRPRATSERGARSNVSSG